MGAQPAVILPQTNPLLATSNDSKTSQKDDLGRPPKLSLTLLIWIVSQRNVIEASGSLHATPMFQ